LADAHEGSVLAALLSSGAGLVLTADEFIDFITAVCTQAVQDLEVEALPAVLRLSIHTRCSLGLRGGLREALVKTGAARVMNGGRGWRKISGRAFVFHVSITGTGRAVGGWAKSSIHTAARASGVVATAKTGGQSQTRS
jgi:hypothetical protein